jgi:hypothetical protein
LAAERDKQEEYEEWLGRMDIPIERQTDIETFRNYLKEELGITGDAQVEALWSGVETQTDLADLGIHGVNIEYPWGTERRYGIQGMPGLWGWAAVQQVREAEE